MLLAEAQHRRLHSAFVWVRQNCLILVNLGNLYRQEEAEQGEQQGEDQGADQGADQGEDRCHRSAHNRRLRATQSPNKGKSVLARAHTVSLANTVHGRNDAGSFACNAWKTAHKWLVRGGTLA